MTRAEAAFEDSRASDGEETEGVRRSAALTGGACVLAAMLVVAVGPDGMAPATRGVMYGGVLVASGLTLFQLLAHDHRGPAAERDRLRWLILFAAASAALATVAGLLLQVALASGNGWLGLFDRGASDVVFGSSSHLAAGQRLVGLMLLAYAATRRADGAPVAALLGACGVLIALTSFFGAGHTATRDPRVVGYALDFVHTTTAAIWAGGLVGLAVVLHHRRPHDALGAATIVRRFSLAASSSVTLLLATGFGLTWAELGPSGGVPFNGYGLVLLAKAGLALATLAIGAVNHFVVVPSVEDGDADAWITLSKTVRFELAALVVLVALTGVLTGLSP